MKYYKDKNELILPIGSYDVDIELGKDDDAIFLEYYKKLNFPDYFGFNWDALYDCLLDLSWMKNDIIVLIHSIKVEKSDISWKIYLELMKDVEEQWNLCDEQLSQNIDYWKNIYNHTIDEVEFENWNKKRKLILYYPESLVKIAPVG